MGGLSSTWPASGSPSGLCGISGVADLGGRLTTKEDTVVQHGQTFNPNRQRMECVKGCSGCEEIERLTRTDRLQETRDYYQRLHVEIGPQAIDKPYYLLVQAVETILVLIERCKAVEAALQEALSHQPEKPCLRCQLALEVIEQAKTEHEEVNNAN